MNLTRLSTFLLVIISICNISLAGTYSGGSGTQVDPYLIATPEDLIELGNTTDDYSSYFLMTQDIDMSGHTFDGAVIGASSGISSVFFGTPFTGNFNGNDHIISDLTVNGRNFCGLFGYIGSGSVVSNLGLENVSVSGSDSVGGLCGENRGTITSIYATGSVSGSDSVGGLCGENRGTITSSYATSSVRGSDRVGGLCGYNGLNSIITSSYASGSVSGNNYVGGLCGENRGSITSSYATGSVSGRGVSVGGLCGRNYSGTIDSSYAIGSVSGNRLVGGFCGPNSGVITSCFWGTQTSGMEVGVSSGDSSGVIGLNIVDMQTLSTFIDAGWDIADANGSVSVWKMPVGWYPVFSWEEVDLIQVPDLSGKTLEQANEILNSIGISIGKVIYNPNVAVDKIIYQQIPDANYFIRQGNFDKVNVIISISKYSGGSGKIDDPFVLSTPEDIISLGENTEDYSNYFLMTQDIDMSGYTFDEAVIGEFGGNFDGGNHSISNLVVNGSGLFEKLNGSISRGIKNLSLVNASITGDNYVGGICGYLGSGVIENCSVSGSVTGYDPVGGICGASHGSILNCKSTATVSGQFWDTGGVCGVNHQYSTISGCVFSGEVNGGLNTGGICGANYGTVQNCYVTGSVSCDYVSHNFGSIGYMLGGICGGSQYRISNCYFAGSLNSEVVPSIVERVYLSMGGISGTGVGKYENCFWDVQSTGIEEAIEFNFTFSTIPLTTSSSSDFIGLPTSVMQDPDLYSAFGWTDGSWTIAEGEYPRLAWEDAGGDVIAATLTPFAGSGTEVDPWLIEDVVDLLSFGRYYRLRSHYFKLTSDIDLTGYKFYHSLISAENVPYGDRPDTSNDYFSGHFDGDGHCISNLSIKAYEGRYVGLFGRIESFDQNSGISNLGLENVYIDCSNIGLDDTSYFYVGGLCGMSLANIDSCYTTGTVVGLHDRNYTARAGGLVGYFSGNNVTISNCYSTADVNGYYAGGLCGTINGTTQNSYATGSVNGTNVGGICADSSNNVISNCFWDVETTGVGSAGENYRNSIGLTTAQMQKLWIYNNAGWDFSTEDGDPADWKIFGAQYPRLVWEKSIDVDGNDYIDMNDWPALSGNWLSSAPEALYADLDKSGIVDLGDLEIFAGYWLEEAFVLSTFMGYWPLDEQVNNSTPDLSAYANSGTIIGSPVCEPGLVNGCYSFSGETDCILVDGCTGISGSAPRTISAFIKAQEDLANTDNSLRCIVSWGSMTDSNKKWFVSLDGNTGQLALGTNGVRLLGGPDLEDGYWHHIAVVLPEGATNIKQVRMYVDGYEVETNASSVSAVINTTYSPVMIGAMNLTDYYGLSGAAVETGDSEGGNPGMELTQFFVGSIDEVQLYDYALTSTDIYEYVAPVLNDNVKLVGFWGLNETEGTSAVDDSYYSNDGIVFGSPTGESGLVGGCYNFNGTSDYIVSSNAINVGGSNARTVSAFIKAEEDLANNDNSLHCITSWGSTEDSNKKWFVSLDNNTGQLALGTNGARLLGGPDLEDGKWHHVAVVLPDGATNLSQVLMYVDGTEIETNAQSVWAIIDTMPTEVVIGALDRTIPEAGERDLVQFFAGAIDEVKIYSRDLIAEEIYDYARAGLGDYYLSPSIVGHWRLDETTGNIAADASENANFGTIFGDPVRLSGAKNGCFVFNGTSDYIITQNIIDISGNSPRTVSAYIKADEDLANLDNSLHCIASWGSMEGMNHKWFVSLDNLSGKLCMGTNGYRIIGGPDLEDGLWHHIAVVVPEMTDSIRDVVFYVDGQIVVTNASQQNPINIETYSSELVIGAMDKSVAGSTDRDMVQFFAGAIDEVQIFNSALSDFEIAGMAKVIFPVNANYGPLVGHWRLDEESEIIAQDTSGSNNDGDVFGNPLRGPGKIDGCYTFNGVSDCVITQSDIGIRGSAPRTVTAYIKANEDLDNIDNSLRCIASWGTTESVNRKWFISLDGTNGQLYVGADGCRITGGPDLEDGQWHHIAVVFPDGGKLIRDVELYVDGQMVETSFVPNIEQIFTISTEVVIGAMDRAESGSSERDLVQFFAGSIDDVRIYNTDLSSDEIAELADECATFFSGAL